MVFSVSEDENGLFLKQFIINRLHPSSKMLKSLKYKTNGITVNGQKKTVRAVLHTGDAVELQTEDVEGEDASIHPSDIPLQIVYEDKDVIVPCKSAGMPTHPSHGHWEDTVANALCYRAKAQGLPFVFRPVNRLDRNTSGLLLIAKNKLSAGRLSASMKAGNIRKTYLAILDGEMTEQSGRIEKALHRTVQSIIVREVCDASLPDADLAITDYRVLSAENGHTLVSANPITGRTHQLRVHFASVGFPITGDDLYGKQSPLIARHALHATVLSFPHPSTNERITVFAPIPNDIVGLIKRFFPQFSEKEINDACRMQ